MKKKSEKKIFKKTPEYIRETINSAGTHTLRIEVRRDGQKFRKTLKIADYPTPSDALATAKKIRDEAINQMSQGFTISGFPTVRELYEESFEVFPQRMKTRQRHDVFFRNGIGEELSSRTIDRITSADIQKTLNVYGRTHTARQTQGLLAIWRRVYRTAAMKEINVIDKTVAVVIPDCWENTPREKSISPEDFDRFCAVLKDYNQTSITGSYRATAIFYAVQIMRYCGLRPAETFALQKSDIDLIRGVISVNKAVRSSETEILTIGKTKTQKSKRVVPIPESLKPILREALDWSKHDFLLADFHGNLFQGDEISQTVNHVAKRAGVKFTLYQLRHQFSTDLFNSGINPTVIRDLMGHESATMSLDYAVSNEGDRVKAVNERSFS